MYDLLIAILLGIVEGITEFLPISSTGHLILISDWMGFTGEFANTFNIVIQLGAILSVIVYFRKQLFPFGEHKSEEEKTRVWDLWKKIAVGVIPILIVGAAFGKQVQHLLFNPLVVATALLVGGVLLIWIEKQKKYPTINTLSSLTYKIALFIGIIQCLALIPGTSRSAATIIGAMLLGSSRVVAAEFSFYLAIPTIAAASGYSLLSTTMLSSRELLLLAIGFIVAFFVAWAVVAGFMKYIIKNDFKAFGYYRIVLGLVILVYILV
ncbi:undecaprenyl-diphosphate phosphatase [Candidatus Woesearchaeota archaeon]|nr:undecaprenyl-diphosphate phosphatase [Candidatus Woesearchaeota archaeon]